MEQLYMIRMQDNQWENENVCGIFKITKSIDKESIHISAYYFINYQKQVISAKRADVTYLQ